LALFATFYFDFGTLNYVVSTASVSRYGQNCGRKNSSKQAKSQNKICGQKIQSKFALLYKEKDLRS
jgi:hypothetical protein